MAEMERDVQVELTHLLTMLCVCSPSSNDACLSHLLSLQNVVERTP
jgi:hypothetical protein